MPLKISAQAMPHFPKLGWWAHFDVANGLLSALHGTSVELGDGFLVEGTWDGDFSRGEFHKSEAFFGSGIRIDGDDVYFAASSAPIDRLFICRDGDHFFASNSLLLMLSQIEASLNPDLDYRRQTLVISEGVEGEDNRFPIRHDTIHYLTQVICRNAVISNGDVSYQRRDKTHTFESFEHYLSELNGALARIGGNFSDASRATAVRPFGTLSTGYDSSAVSCLVRDIGVTECFTYTGSWSRRSLRNPTFDAAPIASALGVEMISLNSSEAPAAVDERLMLAASRIGAQKKLLPLAAHVESHCRSAVVFTGYFGDSVWGLNPKLSLAARALKRHGVSGLDLSELRLKSGFVNVPVPTIFATSSESLLAVSRSKEMTRWRLEKDYDRPIPRRLLEEAGVDRHLFGTTKAAVFNHHSRPTNLALRSEFEKYLYQKAAVGKLYVSTRLFIDKLTGLVLKSLLGLICKAKAFQSLRMRLKAVQNQAVEGVSPLGLRVNLRTLLYHWAVSSAVDLIQSGSLYLEDAPERVDQPDSLSATSRYRTL